MADDTKITAPKYYGVTFDNIRKALYYIIYGKDYSEYEAYKYILPMQGSFMNPIKNDSNDTYVQYFITRDSKMVQDSFEQGTNICRKVATVSLRFIGNQAENWAKFFHHLTKLRDVSAIFQGTCNARLLESIGDIVPTTVLFDARNVDIAFDLDIRVEYIESIDLPWEPLVNVVLSPGEINA
jgi:hypothetical protein